MPKWNESAVGWIPERTRGRAPAGGADGSCVSGWVVAGMGVILADIGLGDVRRGGRLTSMSTTETEAPTLTDGTVVIRALTPDDATGLHEQAVDPLSIRWTQVPDPHTPDMALGFVERAASSWASGSEWVFAVEADDVYAGNIALRDEGLGRAEIAFGSHPAARGTGTIEAALRLLLEWGFTRAGVDTVIWRANVGNWASRKLAWRLGFSVDGVLRGTHEFRGGLVDGWVGTLHAPEKREPRHPWLAPLELSGDLPDGGTIRLRAATDADVERVVEWGADDRSQFWLGRMPWPYTEDDARAWMGVRAGEAGHRRRDRLDHRRPRVRSRAGLDRHLRRAGRRRLRGRLLHAPRRSRARSPRPRP